MVTRRSGLSRMLSLPHRRWLGCWILPGPAPRLYLHSPRGSRRRWPVARAREQLAAAAAFSKALEKLTAAQGEVADAGRQAVAVFGSRKAAQEALGLTAAQLRKLVPRPASAKKPAEGAG